MIFLTPITWALQGDIFFEESSIEDATVFVLDERLQTQSVKTDHDGHFDLSMFLDLNRPYRVFIYPHYLSSAEPIYYGNTENYCDSPVVYKGDSISVELQSGIDIRGQIELDETEILENGIVYAIPIEEHLQKRANYIQENGSFSIFGINKMSSGWKIEIESSNYPTQYLDGDYDDGAIFDSTFDDLGNFSILSGIDVSGFIRDEQDHGLDQSNVHVYSGGEVKTVQTEEDGWFVVEGLPPGDVLLWSSLDGYATTYYPDSPHPDQSIPCLEENCSIHDANLFLNSESRLTIYLSDMNGEPISNGSVLLYNELHTVGRGNGIENGSVVIDKLYDGNYHLMIFARSSGFYHGWYGEIPTKTNGDWDHELETPKWVTVDGDSEIHIQLQNSARFELLYEDEFGKPIYGNEVFLYERQGVEDVLVYRDTTDINGTVIFSGLSEGRYFINSIHQALCITDMSYTSSFAFSNFPMDIEAQYVQDQEIFQKKISVFRDSDHDKMSDQWEMEVGLEVGRDDSQEDPDKDGLINLEEYYAQSNPFDAGCDCKTQNALFIAFVSLIFIGRRRDVS